MHPTDVDATVSAWTRAQDVHEAESVLQSAGVPASAAALISELFEDTQLKSREFVRMVEHPEAGLLPHTRAAFTMSDSDARTERHAPLYGQDTDYVLRDQLGYSPDEVRELEDTHVTARQP
jgi:benzylsuccinate CoA-transferase BbsF subunit